MTQYEKLIIAPPEEISEIAALFETLKEGLDTLVIIAKENATSAKLLASGANVQLMLLITILDAIIVEIEKLKGGTFSEILAHPYAYRIKAEYDRVSDTMTLTPESALKQVKEAFDDLGDALAPDKFNNYGGLIIIGVAPGIAEFGVVLDAIGKFFSQQDLLDLKEQILERWAEKDKPDVKLSEGLDFIGLSQEELFPEYVGMLNEVQSFVEGIKSNSVSASGTHDDTIKFLDKKLVEGEKIVETIKAFLDKFILELSGAGVYYKTFDIEEHTADTIKEELLEDTPTEWKTSDYSVVLGIFGGSGSIELIFELLSLD